VQFHSVAAFTHSLSDVAGAIMSHDAQQNHRLRSIQILQLCWQLGWSIGAIEGGVIKLHFKDPHAIDGIRTLCIQEQRHFVYIFTVSHAFPRANDVPEEVLGHLLQRNRSQRVSSWSGYVDDNGTAFFLLEYKAIKAGLDALMLMFICDEILPEVSAFDAKMRLARLF
jgi:hypothetical protein